MADDVKEAIRKAELEIFKQHMIYLYECWLSRPDVTEGDLAAALDGLNALRARSAVSV